MKVLLLSSLLFFSCSKEATLRRDSANALLEGVRMDIGNLKEIRWPAGFREEALVSQSITFTITMPKVDQDDLDYLISQRGIDSWILRVLVYRNGERQDLGSLYSPFRPRKLSRTSTDSAKAVSLKIYYAAAYASEKWRSSKCPPLGHNRQITEMEIDDPKEEFSLTIGGGNLYPEKSQLIELTPSSFNGGMSLTGEYSFEIAPYDSQKKVIHAPFKKIPGKVIVSKEESVSLPSCSGIDPNTRPRSY